jgi:hypothetical protein
MCTIIVQIRRNTNTVAVAADMNMYFGTRLVHMSLDKPCISGSSMGLHARFVSNYFTARRRSICTILILKQESDLSMLPSLAVHEERCKSAIGCFAKQLQDVLVSRR